MSEYKLGDFSGFLGKEYDALSLRVKELEALAQKLVDALGEIGNQDSYTDYGKVSLALAEASKLCLVMIAALIWLIVPAMEKEAAHRDQIREARCEAIGDDTSHPLMSYCMDETV